MLRLIGEVTGLALAVCALLAILWRVVVLPNLREQLFKPIQESHRQVTQNRHANPQPTVLDRLDDIENSVELVGLNLLAVLRRLGESERDRERLWLIVESIVHEQKGKEQ